MSARARSLVLLAALALGAPAEVQATDASVSAPSEPVNTENTPPVELLVVLGSREGSGVDPQLDALPALRKPPFDTFTRQTVLERSELRIAPGDVRERDLPNGRKVRIALRERLPDGKVRLSIAIHRAGKDDYLRDLNLTAAPGDWLLVVGQKHERGTLIVGVRVGPRP
ncbi:MAG: hypothetical protein ABW252_20140 [Polyangiales bacterium]